ncbi:YusW family protein [Sporosarcina sp. G11-34]|uniref:YusW family protein n=1 Tax=Sporosarcina sp. G11-34 TaxID=2849605 RepID=UPI0022A92984|nr:YusW family protein [Sporosarcina sp. G11-34]MCZ2260329.1 YusW family protein [Sporosarcina sp. G11-34]
MIKLKLFGTILFASVLLIGGCGNSNKKVVDGNKDEPLITSEPEDEGGSMETGDGYGFSEFDLEIDIDGADAIDLDYKVVKKVEAEYENKLQDYHLKDEPAMAKIHDLFMDIKITKDTPEDEVKQKILQFLHIDNYSKFDLEVVFDNGQLLEIIDGE